MCVICFLFNYLAVKSCLSTGINIAGYSNSLIICSRIFVLNNPLHWLEIACLRGCLARLCEMKPIPNEMSDTVEPPGMGDLASLV